MNQLQLAARIIEREALRYTPAGIPLVSAKLLHSLKQQNDEILQMINFEITAIAAGKISERFNQAELGNNFLFSGFLTRKSHKSKTLVFHIVDFEVLLEH